MGWSDQPIPTYQPLSTSPMHLAVLSLLVASLVILGHGAAVSSNAERRLDFVAQRDCQPIHGSCSVNPCCYGQCISNVCVAVSQCLHHV